MITTTIILISCEKAYLISKLPALVCEYPFRCPKTIKHFDNAGCNFLRCLGGKWISLDPLGEVIYKYANVLISNGGRGQLADHVHAYQLPWFIHLRKQFR